MPRSSPTETPRRWWQGPADPVLRTIRLLVLVLWPTVWVWVLPGQHRPGDGLVLAWLLVVVYSAAALLLLLAGPRTQRVLPACLTLFAAAAVIGAMAGPAREMALLVPLFLGALGVIAAMRLSVRATWWQVGVASLAGVVCVWWAAQDPVQVLVTSVAVVAGIATPSWAVLRLRAQLDAARAREHRLARTDPLTGTLNRRGLFEAATTLLDQVVEAGRTGPGPYAGLLDVLTLDLDDFKQLNDTYGHAAGDDALRAVAQALQALPGPEPCLVARLGGEEFLVLAPATAAGPGPLAEAVRAAGAVVTAAGVRTSASVGAVRGTPPAEPEERTGWLMRQIDRADELMYAAKRSGGDRAFAG